MTKFLPFIVGVGLLVPALAAESMDGPNEKRSSAEVVPAPGRLADFRNKLALRGIAPEYRARFRNATVEEFDLMCTWLLEGPETAEGTTLVMFLGENYRRLEQSLPPESKALAGRAFDAALHHSNPNGRLQALFRLSGVNHPVVRGYLEDMSRSENPRETEVVNRYLALLSPEDGSESEISTAGDGGDGALVDRGSERKAAAEEASAPMQQEPGFDVGESDTMHPGNLVVAIVVSGGLLLCVIGLVLIRSYLRRKRRNGE